MGASTSCLLHNSTKTPKRQRLSAVVEKYVKNLIKGRWVGRERNKINMENKPKTE